MKIFKKYEFEIGRDQMDELEANLKFMAIKGVQNNIIYYAGKIYRPQNKPIQSLMSKAADKNEETIKKKICQTVNLEPSTINLPSTDKPDNHKTEI